MKIIRLHEIRHHPAWCIIVKRWRRWHATFNFYFARLDHSIEVMILDQEFFDSLFTNRRGGPMGHDSKYGKIMTEKKTIPDDEPLFLLRGQDRLAPMTVDFYADQLGEAGLHQAARAVREAAKAMRDWPKKKMPD